MERAADMPCGNCDVGLYDHRALLKGADIFANSRTRDEALSIVPKCKRRPGLPCAGGADFCQAMTFPIDRQALEREALT